MAGGSARHNRLTSRITAVLETALGGRCHVFSSDQRIQSRERRYVYPDVSVVCGAPVIAQEDVLVNPTIVVDVLSSTTEQYDRGLEWDGYQALPSLTDYVLVSQDRAHIEHFARTPDGRWVYTSASAGEHIRLTGGTVLDIDAIFIGVLDLPGA